MKLFKHKELPYFEVNNINDVTDFVCKHYAVQPFQIHFSKCKNPLAENLTNDWHTQCYFVNLTNKLGEWFATVGLINFDPNEV